MLNTTTMLGFQVTQQKIATLSNTKVQDLIKLGKLKFEESNGPTGVEDLFEAKAEMIRREEKALKEVGSENGNIEK